jgi:DNA-binding response OmpR family regulator
VPATVLIVEDDFDAREVLAILLRFEGFTVITAENGLTGLDAVQTERVDLMITDVEMPHLDGIEMIKRLRALEQFRSLPIIVVSACERRLMKTALAAGATDTIRKPAKLDLLLTTVRGLLHPSEE